MIKILIGGSPCTHWSIAQKNGRETEPKGIGWELFKNYLIAKEKFKPDFFLYENNKSAAQPIKDQISRELGVDLMYINSALVSAQNRQRFYAFNWTVEQPKDRGIVLRDILHSGEYLTSKEKAYCLLARYSGAKPQHTHEKALSTMVAEPIRIGTIESDAKNKDHDSKQYRVYSPDGKATTLCGKGGGVGAKTGLYACPIENGGECAMFAPPMTVQEATKKGYAEILHSECVDLTFPNRKTRRGRRMSEKSSCLTTASNELYEYCGTVDKPIYEVKDGLITIKGKQYPIKLADGYYIIRKLTVTECCRLQTLPDDYCRAVSNSRAYAGLGNGFTAEVIIHILSGALKDVPRDEEIVVLSMYDGIGTGRYCLDKMGFTNVKYYAYEIDKYAMQVAMSNYPDIIQCGDAFAVREDGWKGCKQ